MTLDPEDPRLDPDTREILRRRATFIRRSLAGAGFALASLNACGAEACLSAIGVVDSVDSGDLSGDLSGSELQVCLTQDIPDAADASEVGPEACLTDVPYYPDTLDTVDTADDTPQVCLSPRQPDALDAVGDVSDGIDDAPQVCLKVGPDANDDVPDAPQICLSPPAPDTSEPG